MVKQGSTYRLETSDYKILETISFLNEKKIYPLSEGVYKILKGDIDIDLDDFMSIPTYKTLVSYSQKNISNLIMMLIRHGYLERIYDPVSDNMYLKISNKGEVEFIKYHKKHKYKFVKKKVKGKQLFYSKND